MNKGRKIITAVGATVVVGAFVVGGVVLTRTSGQATNEVTGQSSASAMSSGVATRTSTLLDDLAGGGALETSSFGVDSVAGTSSNSAPRVGGSGSSADAAVDATSTASDGSTAGSVSAAEAGGGGPSAPSPVGDRAEWGPVAPVVPVGPGAIPALVAGPILSSPSWSCGTKVILSVTATDPQGVASVWGSFYIGGSKQGFTSSNSAGDVWATTIVNGAELPVTGLVIYAKDGSGNNSSLAVGTICA